MPAHESDPFFRLTPDDVTAIRRDRFRAALDRSVPVRENGECWEWRGHRDEAGYGLVVWKRHGITRSFLAHRIAYEVWVREPHPDLVVDHLCANKACCNPAHLDLVTQGVNVERWAGWNGGQCKRGHALTPENIYLAPGSGKRQCRPCQAHRRETRRQTITYKETP